MLGDIYDPRHRLPPRPPPCSRFHLHREALVVSAQLVPLNLPRHHLRVADGLAAEILGAPRIQMRSNPRPAANVRAPAVPLTSVSRVMKMKAPAESGQASWSQILRTWPKQAITSTAEELCFSCRTGSNCTGNTSTETTAIDFLSLSCPPPYPNVLFICTVHNQ